MSRFSNHLFPSLRVLWMFLYVSIIQAAGAPKSPADLFSMKVFGLILNVYDFTISMLGMPFRLRGYTWVPGMAGYGTMGHNFFFFGQVHLLWAE